MRIAGRFTNHDDAIEDDTLAASLATTAKLVNKLRPGRARLSVRDLRNIPEPQYSIDAETGQLVRIN